MLFIMIFVLMLTPIVVQTYTSFSQERAYRKMISNIAYANRLNTTVSTKIEPVVWDIVAGKVKFDDSGITQLIDTIKTDMNYISVNAYSVKNNGIIEIAMRALSTLEAYLDKLKTQIQNRGPVEENESVLEEIRVCVALINDLLQDFSSKQLDEVAILNQEMARQSNLNFFVNITLILIVISVGLFAFFYIYKSIMNPIEKLLSMSNKISEGDFSSRVELVASDEFNELALGMNTMSEKIELLIEKSIEEQKQLRISEAKMLQAQITPHFLYNTLDAIIWAAEAKNMSDVITLVSSLSSFFKISLSHGIDFIPISNEIAHVRSYLTIQQMRYSDVLSYEINVDEGLDNQHVLKLLLQPLVENSLYHGIKNTRERGKITISVTKVKGGVRFSVADNGIGMTRNELKELRRELNSDIDSGIERGYGLFNVNRRLQLYYDSCKGIEVRSEYKKGTEVSFVLNIL